MIRRHSLLAGAFAASLSLPALATVETAPPPPGPPRAVQVPPASETTLDNGLRVIAVRRADLPLVTMSLVLRSGSEVDPPARPGAASMLAELLTQGSKTRSAPEIASAAAALGGEIEVVSGWDETRAGLTVTTPRAGAALALLADVVRNPALDVEELERLRRQTGDDLRLAFSQPGALSGMLARRATFGAGGYGHPASGTPASIAAITRDELAALHARWYRPDNAILVFAGDLTADDAFKLARGVFGDWVKPATALPQAEALMAKSAVPARLAVDLSGSGQASVVVARPAVARSAPDWYAGTVANMVLGGSYSARLNEEIRIKRGLSYGARSSLDALRGGGWLTTSVQTKNPSAAEVVRLSIEQIDSLASRAPDAAELAARKATLIGGFGRSLDTTGGLAAQLGALAIYGIALDELNRFIGKVEAVSADDVAGFARRHLAGEGAHIVVVGDAGEYGEALSRLWPGVKPVAAERLDLGRADLGLGSGG